MIPSREIQQTVDRQLFPGTFVFHGLSRPVIRYDRGKYCLAMFITPFSLLSFSDCLFDRPNFWVTADLETGTLIDLYQCHLDPSEEFCDSEYERRYDLRSVSDKPITKSYFDSAFALLDEVRKKLIESGEFDQHMYNVYLRRLLKVCPLPYRKFFRSLSI